MTRRRRNMLITGIVVVVVGVVAVAYPTSPLGFRCWIAPKADLTAHPDTYPWIESTTDLALSVPITHQRGSEDEQAESNSESTLAFKDTSGRYSDDNPMSDLWPDWGENTPVKFETNLGDGSGWQTEWVQYASEITDVWPSGTSKLARTHVTCAGLFRRLGRNPELRSPLFRSMAGVAPDDYVPHAYWPMEDGADASRFASGLPGGAPVTPGGATFAADDSLVSSDSLPSLDETGSIILDVPPYTPTDRWFVQHVVKIPTKPPFPNSPDDHETDLTNIYVDDGTVARWRVSILTTTVSGTEHAQLNVRGYDSAGNVVENMGGNMTGLSTLPHHNDFWGTWAMVTLGARDDHPNVGEYTVYVGLAIDTTNTNISGPSFDGDAGSIRRGELRGNAQQPRYGHFGVFVDSAFDSADAVNNIKALLGHAGEMAHDRIARLSTEERLPYDVTATESAVMGPQLIGTLVENFRDCERTDHGQLDDSKGTVAYRALSEFYNQTPAMVINAAETRRLFMPYVPTTDDQKRINKVTAKRPRGSFAVVENTDDIKGVPGMRRGVGVYEGDIEPNVQTDAALPFHASWIANRVGAVVGKRYPFVTLDFLRAPDLATKFRAMRLGDRVTITSPPRQGTRYDIDVIFAGWATIHEGRRKWKMVANCVAYSPYEVGIAGDGSNPGKWAQTSPGTQLAAELAPGADTLSVTVAGPLFSTAASPMVSLIFGGEITPVVSISGGSSPQTIVVQRTLPKRHLTGTPVRIHQPAVAIL